MFRPDDLHGLCRRGRLVLDKLRLIQHLIEKHFPLIGLHIAFQMVIGTDEHIPLSAALDDFTSLRLVSFHRADREFRREPVKLFRPVVYQGRRADDQGGPDAALLLLRQKNGDDLQGFPEAHLVGENPAESAARQGTQPLVPVYLIAAQDLTQFRRDLIV